MSQCKKEIDSSDHLSQRDKDRELNEIKDSIEDAFAKRKLSEQHYNLLRKIKQVTVYQKAQIKLVL